MANGPKAHSGRDFISLTVLALLYEQPRHPYEMQRLMRERHKDFAVGKTRSFYDAVNRLLKAGYVEPAETSREGHHPERTVYRITDAGREDLASWLFDLLATPVAEHPVFTVALNFLPCLAPDTALRALQQRAVALESAVAGLETAQRGLQEQLHLPRLVLLEVEHTQVLRQAELEWLRSLIADLQSGSLDRRWCIDCAETPAEQTDARSPAGPPDIRLNAATGIDWLIADERKIDA
jgi:DNA-binding PadR family transcriptional regulator